MPVHLDYVAARDDDPEAYWPTDELGDGTVLDEPALGVGSLVITGSREELLALLDEARKQVGTLPNPGDIDLFVDAYIKAALWSSTDNADESGGEPLDANYGPEDLHEDAVAEMRGDCVSFMRDQREVLAKLQDLHSYNLDQAGHDFWLTRNGHGAGFWDRGLGNPGDRLSEAARVYGTQDIYVGDDGKLYV